MPHVNGYRYDIIEVDGLVQKFPACHGLPRLITVLTKVVHKLDSVQFKLFVTSRVISKTHFNPLKPKLV
jgi:hypothetical protein